MTLRIGATAALVAALVWWVGPQSVIASLGAIKPDLWLLSTAAILAAIVLGCANLHILMREHSGQSFSRFLRIYWIGWAIGLVTPGQIGDVATVSVMLARKGVDWRGTVGRTLVDKVITLAIMLALALVAVIDTWHQLSFRIEWLPALSALSLIGLGVVMLVIAARALVGGRWGRMHEHGRQIVLAITDVAHTRPDLLLINLCLTVIKILLFGAAYWCAFLALGHDAIEFLRTTALSMAGGLLAYLPISFNGIGAVEIAAVGLFGIHGIPASSVLTAYLLLRLTVFALAWIPAGLLLIGTGNPQV